MKTIVVLGMGRSATSLVAKGLSNEIDMGPSLWTSPSSCQPKGHYESNEFVNLNNKILGAAGGAWDKPPPEDDIIVAGNDMSDDIKRLVERAGKGHKIWGWKDPRTTLTIRCFLPYLENPHFVAVFRDPEEVAESLIRRQNGDKETWIKLAKEYNRRLLSFLGEFAL